MVAYYLPPLRDWQRHTLIVASFVFYAANQPWLLLLLVCSIAVNVVTSHFVYHGSPPRRTTYAALGVGLNLAVLAFFKYSPLFGKSFFSGTGSVGEFLVSIPLPIGISFFTFQGITLLVDTLRVQEERAEFALPHGFFGRHAVNTTLFIAFFPQLVAGPIVKAHDFVPQIVPKFFRDIDWDACFRALVTGYFLKMVVADNLKDHTFWIARQSFKIAPGTDLLVMLFGYSIQIFADFAGYSLIAIGCASLFGYRLPQNFNFPYISRSFSEFWRRWHISLSSFLREYLYFPLGGNRRGGVRTYVNLMVVMLLGGFWHGAAWSYMVWGGCHGVALAVERFCGRYVTLPDLPLVNALRMLGVFVFVTAAWLLFKLPDFSQAVDFARAVEANMGLPPDLQRCFFIAAYSVPVILWHLHHLWGKPVLARVPGLAAVAYGFMLFLIVTNSGAPGAFVYFQF